MKTIAMNHHQVGATPSGAKPYTHPTIEVIELETQEGIMQLSGGRMSDVDIEEDNSSWTGISWD